MRSDTVVFVRKVVVVRAHNNRRGADCPRRNTEREREREREDRPIEGLTEGWFVCRSPLQGTKGRLSRARIFRIILPYKRLSSKLIAPTAHAKPNKCNRAHRLYRGGLVCDRPRNRTRKFLRRRRAIRNNGRRSTPSAAKYFREPCNDSTRIEPRRKHFLLFLEWKAGRSSNRRGTVNSFEG